MITNGFITLNRSFMKWQWYDDERTKSIFLHLLLTANYEESRWRGTLVKRGQRVITVRKLAEELNMSKSALGRILVRLEKSEDIIRERVGNHTILTLKNYESYASSEPVSGQERDTSGTVSGTQVGQKWDKLKNNKKNKKYNNIISAREDKNFSSPSDTASFTAEMFSQKAYERYGKRLKT